MSVLGQNEIDFKVAEWARRNQFAAEAVELGRAAKLLKESQAGLDAAYDKLESARKRLGDINTTILSKIEK